MQLILPANNLLCNLFRILEEFFLVLFAELTFCSCFIDFYDGLGINF